jgi:ABC-type nitrate/sulfonate/bicarbonate transport system permease component
VAVVELKRAGGAPIRGRRPVLRRTARSPVLLGTVGIAFALALGEVLPRTGVLSEYAFSPSSAVFRSLWDQMHERVFWSAVRSTMEGWAIGLALAFLIGVTLGIVLGSSRWARAFTRPTIDTLRSLPGIGILPLIVFIAGIGMTTKVILIVFGAMWFFVFQTMYGVLGVDPVARDTVRSFGFNRLQQVRHLVLPSALPYVATGLRLASSVGLVICVTVEIVSGSPGLGREILFAQAGGGGGIARMWALIVAIGILGVIVHLVFSRTERFALSWHISQRGHLGDEAS